MNKKAIITALLALETMAGQAQEITGRGIDEQLQPMVYDDFDAPSVFSLKSSNSYRHLTLTHKKKIL